MTAPELVYMKNEKRPEKTFCFYTKVAKTAKGSCLTTDGH
jgi:hypothetical protein